MKSVSHDSLFDVLLMSFSIKKKKKRKDVLLVSVCHRLRENVGNTFMSVSLIYFLPVIVETSIMLLSSYSKKILTYMLLAWNLTEVVMEVTFIEKWSNISFCSYQDFWVFQRYKISYLLSM